MDVLPWLSRPNPYTSVSRSSTTRPFWTTGSRTTPRNSNVASGFLSSDLRKIQTRVPALTRTIAGEGAGGVAPVLMAWTVSGASGRPGPEDTGGSGTASAVCTAGSGEG